MRPGIPFLLLMTVFSGCNVPNASRDEKRSPSQEDLSKVPTDELIRRLADTAGGTRTGRYQVIVAKANTFKFDTATGSTWVFDEQSTSWKALPDTPFTDASVEARIRTVVERAVTPLIAEMVYNPQTRQLDKVSQAEKKRRIQAIVQQALGDYGNLKNDPLAIRNQKHQ
jgi:hypothetical protein